MVGTLADTASDAHTWSVDGMVWTFGSLVVSLLFLAVIAWYLVARSKAKVAVAQAAGYRELADDATDAQDRTSEKLTAMDQRLSELTTRLGNLERILTQVE